MMPLTELLEKTVDCLSVCFEKPSALYTSSEGLLFFVSNVEESLRMLEPKRGVVLCGWKHGQNFEMAVSDVSEQSLLEAVRVMGNMAGLAVPEAFSEKSPSREKKEFATQVQIPFQSVSIQEKFRLCRSLCTYPVQKDRLVTNATAILKEEETEEIFVDTGKVMCQQISRVDTLLYLWMKDKDECFQIWDGESLSAGFEGAGIAHDRIDKIIEDGKRLLHAPRLEPGFYDCIVTPQVAGMLAHEAFGHGMETDLFLQGRSRAQLFMRKSVGSELVNMTDNPAYSDSTTLFFFDHAGFEAVPTPIMRNGILVQGLTDYYSYIKLGLDKQTPNTRRESYERKAYARMTNTYFEAGKDEVKDMIASVKSGFLIRYPTNGMEDPKQWGIQIEALMAEEIKNGCLTGKVYSPVIITGYVPDVLNSISMVSKEFAVSTLGMCGKGHKEWVKVHDGGPWLKLRVRLG
ncbi:MAG: TldD/PmbA family protein [Candidatus Aureabacteria bacterium]|nr:TldD/PmbA family protein [Candidatus Auribacterota bacterium]